MCAAETITHITPITSLSSDCWQTHRLIYIHPHIIMLLYTSLLLGYNVN